MACGAASTIQVNGLRLQVYRWGRPELRPALLLHSLAAHSHWWDWVAPLLAEHFQVVALDLRGHGGSDWVEPAAYRAVDYAGDIVAVLDALGWRSPLVIALLCFTAKIAVTGHATSEPSGSVHLPPMDGMSVGWPASTARPSWMNS